MGVISWIIFGLIAGILAKWIMPGKDGGGFFMTIILGIVGAVVGGWLAKVLGLGDGISEFSIHNLIAAIIGSIVVLVVFRMIRK